MVAPGQAGPTALITADSTTLAPSHFPRHRLLDLLLLYGYLSGPLVVWSIRRRDGDKNLLCWKIRDAWARVFQHAPFDIWPDGLHKKINLNNLVNAEATDRYANPTQRG